MSWTKAVTIWCDGDGCNQWHDGIGGGTIGDIADAATARRNGARYGWTFKRGRDLCPECTEQEQS